MRIRRWMGRVVLLAMVAGGAGCGGAPYSPLSDSTWIEVDRGLVIRFDDDETVEFENEQKGEDAELTYAPVDGRPGVYHFKDRDGKALMEADLSSFAAEANEFRARDFTGGALHFVRDEGEARARFDRRVALLEQQAKKTSISGAPRDVGRYTDLLAEFGPEWATYYALSQDPSLADEDKKLGLFSERWNATQDSFARQDMRAAELEKIEQRIRRISALEYVALPFGHLMSGNGGGPGITLTSGASGGYQAELKGFPVLGELCRSGISYGNAQGVTVAIAREGGNQVCHIPVSDESVARQLEGLRAQHRLQIKGVGLFKLGPTNGTRIELLPVGARVALGEFGYDPDQQAPALFTTLVWGEPRKAQ